MMFEQMKKNANMVYGWTAVDNKVQKPDKVNHYIQYDYVEEEIFTTLTKVFKGNEIYFSSAEQTDRAIDIVGKERIKKYYLGVKD